MATLHDNKGIALITALLFTLISLAIIMALLTIVTQGTRVSGASKSYSSATEAGYGAVDMVSRDILPAIFKGSFISANYASVGLSFPLATCFNQKLGSPTSLWTDCTTGLPASLDPTQSPDMIFNLKADNDPTGFKVYAKIADTRCGGDTTTGEPCSNSDNSGVDYLDAGSGVTSSSGSVTPQHRPAYYRIEVQSERAVNPNEKSQLSVLYAY